MKRLHLLHTFDGEHDYVVGVNCTAIEERPNGAFVLVRGNRRDTLPAHRVDHYTDEPRPGLTPERTPKPERNGLSPPPEPGKLPKGVRESGDAARPWGCVACNLTSSTVHGVKVHYSKTHAGA